MNKYETEANRRQLNWGIAHATKRLKEIVACPETPLHTKRIQADSNIAMLVRDILPLLPKGKQQEIQACLDLREYIWHSFPSTPTPSPTDGSFSTLQAE